MYDTDNYLYLHLTYDEDLGTCISILRAENKQYSYPIGFVPIRTDAPICLKVIVDHDRLQFFYRRETDSDYLPIGETFDCSFLSDEACDEGCIATKSCRILIFLQNPAAFFCFIELFHSVHSLILVEHLRIVLLLHLDIRQQFSDRRLTEVKHICVVLAGSQLFGTDTVGR